MKQITLGLYIASSQEASAVCYQILQKDVYSMFLSIMCKKWKQFLQWGVSAEKSAC